MASRLMALAAAAATVPVVMAQGATIAPEGDVPAWELAQAMTLSLDIIPLTYQVVPLTMSQGLNQTETARGAIRIPGQLVIADPATYTTVNQSSQIGYLSCDDPAGDGLITPDMMLATLMRNNLSAILLYTTAGSLCSLEGSGFEEQAIFTMADGGDAAMVLSYLNGTMNTDEPITGTISGNTTNSNADAAANNQGSNNSAVAMSILYSITGLITMLFLVIIATGAIRAHRYPERYGPRSGYGGQPRQSRAKGIARAVLETIPIVKFGSPMPSKPDPALELESQGPADVNTAISTTGRPTPESEQTDAEAPKPRNDVDKTTSDTKDSAAKSTDRAAEGEEHLGCSICTDDFAVGQDVRVLPCNHKFHPACVDPWLVNVSGTCPLCRLDLRPHEDKKDSNESVPDDAALPPPLDLEGHDSDEASTHRRRVSRFFDLNRLRHASAQERIEVLRQYRTEQQGETNSGEVEAEERSRRARVADKLRDKFRIRTRAQSPASGSHHAGDS